MTILASFYEKKKERNYLFIFLVRSKSTNLFPVEFLLSQYVSLG